MSSRERERSGRESDQLRGKSTRGGDADLLAEDGADGDLEGIPSAGGAQAGLAAHGGGESAIAREMPAMASVSASRSKTRRRREAMRGARGHGRRRSPPGARCARKDG